MEERSFGEQLQLFEGEDERLAALPWGGRSPRALTRVGLGLILKAQAKKSVSDFVRDPRQLDFWLAEEKAPRVYRGAPLLLPLMEDDYA